MRPSKWLVFIRPSLAGFDRPLTVTKNPTNSTYPRHSVVTVTATPDPGWYFSNWSGDTNGSVNPLNVTMLSDMVITGHFQQFPTYTLTLATNGQGTITLNPAGGSYSSNSVATATATPVTGWVFTSWSGSTNSSANPLSLTMNTNVSLTGNFAQLPAFDLQPRNVTNVVGSTVSFSVHAVGNTPLKYEWFFSNGLLTGATNTSLTLTNVPLTDAGNYWVVATNNYGTATSSLALLVITNSSGQTNVVNSPDEASLRAAIKIGGLVGITFNGTVTITNTINITNNVILDAENVSATISGGNAVRLFYVAPGVMFSVTNLTLADGSCIVTNGAAGTPADAGAIYNDGGTVTLVSCTLTNNNAQSLINGGLARGGAIFNNGGSVSLFGSAISNNAALGGVYITMLFGGVGGAGFGGAIFTTNGSLSIVNCSLNSNLCTSAAGPLGASFGGAVFQSSGFLAITNGIFLGNLALGGSAFDVLSSGPEPAYGGALATVSGSVAIDHSQFIGDTAKGGDAGYHTTTAPAFGGAVYCASVLAAGNSTFFGNQSLSGNGAYPAVPVTDGCGGAIYNLGSIVLNSCSICSNYTQGGYGTTYGFSPGPGGNGLGGGVFNASQLTATNCTIALNSAVSGSGSGNTGGAPLGINGNAVGGGIYNHTNATFVAMNLTIASNFCIASGPAFQGSNGIAAGTQIANTNGTLRLHNSLLAYGGTNGNSYGIITDDGYNISSDGSANLDSGSSYNFTDPMLGPLANYGGPTPCMALRPDSPAIDFGDSSGAPATDQRGFARPHGTGVDMGAYEYGSDQTDIPYLYLTSLTNSVVLTFAAYPTVTYALQSSTGLSTWTDISTNGPFNSSTNVSQTISEQGSAVRFFRLLLVQ